MRTAEDSIPRLKTEARDTGHPELQVISDSNGSVVSSTVSSLVIYYVQDIPRCKS